MAENETSFEIQWRRLQAAGLLTLYVAVMLVATASDKLPAGIARITIGLTWVGGAVLFVLLPILMFIPPEHWPRFKRAVMWILHVLGVLIVLLIVVDWLAIRIG